MNKNYIIITSIIACIILYFAEQVLAVNYGAKTLCKIILFVVIPYIHIRLTRKSKIKTTISFTKVDKRRLKLGFLFGICSFFIILIAYYLLGGYIDFNSIVRELQNKSKITPRNFIFVGLYITFVNSFLEEFFFRGFIFLNLYKLGYRKLAYVYSSILFGLYHIVIFKTWFNLWITILALLGLIVIGFIFDFLDTKSENFVNSWILHILADSAIILIGFKIFQII